MLRLRRLYSAAKTRVFWRRAIILAVINFVISVAASLIAQLEAGAEKLSIVFVASALLSGVVAFAQTLKEQLHDFEDSDS